MVSTSVRNLQRRHSSAERAKEWIRRPPAAIHPNCIWSLPYLPRTLDPKYMCRGANEQSASRTALSPGQTAPNRCGCPPRVPPYRPLPPRRSGRALWWCFGGDPGGHWPGLNSAHTFGRVAQRDRASAFEAEDRSQGIIKGDKRSERHLAHDVMCLLGRVDSEPRPARLHDALHRSATVAAPMPPVPPLIRTCPGILTLAPELRTSVEIWSGYTNPH